MNRFFWLLRLPVLLATSAPAAPSSEVCNASRLPEQVRGVLEAQFPPWKYETLEDFNEYYRNLWMEAAPGECPGIVEGHFDHTSRVSYAFLLMSPAEKNALTYNLVVVSENDEKEYQAKSIASFESPYHFPAISKAKPGRYSDPQKTRAITISADGILLEELEVGATLHYEVGGKYRKLPV